MQVRVPQNIDQDDKIIGSLTLGQLIYAFIGGIILVLLVVVGLPFAVFAALAIPVILVTLSLTVATVNGRPLARIAIDFVLWFFGPRQRLWQDPANLAIKHTPAAPPNAPKPVPTASQTATTSKQPSPNQPTPKRDWLSNPSQNWLAQGEQSQQAISQEVDELASLGQLGPEPLETTTSPSRRVILGKNKLEVSSTAPNPVTPATTGRILKVQRAS